MSIIRHGVDVSLDKMKIWYDACTGKHLRYGAALARRLRKLGHDVTLTTREHPDTLSLASLLNEKPVVVGKYAPASKMSRLKESARRQLLFCEMFERNVPDLAMMHVSVECARTAFGLGIPLISTFDTVHAEAQCRLTVPLTDTIVASEAIPLQAIFGYGAKKVVQFAGVDEVAWIKGSHPTVKFEYERPFIVVRQTEVKAAYANGMRDITQQVAKKLSSTGKVIFLTRYDKKKRKGLVVPKTFVDSASIAAQADLVVSVGGTISREAALSGTPSIAIQVFKRQYVNSYIAEKGFPLFVVEPSEVLSCAKKCLGKRRNVKLLLQKLENPVDTVEKVLRNRSRHTA